MKSNLLIVLFSIITSLSFAQAKVDTYYGSYIDRKFNIRAELTNGKLTVYLELFTGVLQDMFYLRLESYEIENFVSALKQARNKFIEWKKVAKDNDIPYMTKGMDITFYPVGLYMYDPGRNLRYLELISLVPIFTKSINADYRLQLSALIGMDKEQAVRIIFTKPKEIDKLIAKLDTEYLLFKLSKQKQSSGELFK